MNQEQKKEKRLAYLQREEIGGVYAVKNTQNGKLLIAATTDLQGSQNRLNFAKMTNTPLDYVLQEDWKSFGKDVFVFETLEELKRKAEQTPQEFSEDVKTLAELWKEKFSPEQLYRK